MHYQKPIAPHLYQSMYLSFYLDFLHHKGRLILKQIAKFSKNLQKTKVYKICNDKHTIVQLLCDSHSVLSSLQ